MTDITADFEEIEAFANGGKTEPKEMDIHRDDDGETHLTFGGMVAAADIAAALGELPAGAVFSDNFTSYFCNAEDCAGAEKWDEEHHYPIVTMIFFVPDESVRVDRSDG